ncbi:5-methyltetrahydrofolate--homocysteine methyltransferase [Neiella marina]|uniref:5-methyltetrahydrofolate--homocysteine methyltransferase n=1 Tax=Neiella marina TaxID=508461 RepID=A0A8J2U944_9GAMM|nr:vitamin B12 dependent-methionine synthase activation domain-containing protein [Neiella marina]GGA87560.1 5-methyltetrahydrofolate--homocysteine methyltransferase [Neiella marina]
MTVIQYQFSLADFDLDIAEIASLMGYPRGHMPAEILDLIEQEQRVFPAGQQVSGGYRLIPCQLAEDDHTIRLEQAVFAPGRRNFKRYKHAEAIAVFACSAGSYIAERSKQLMAEGQLLEGYVVDVMGSCLVEQAMNDIQQRLKDELAEQGLQITNRYSPGYCSWNIAEQRALFDLLPDKFCGIELSESCLMMPIKSISGLIGVGPRVRFREHSCEQCNSTTCIYRQTKSHT